MIYGSHSELVEQGVDTKQLLGLIHEKEKKDEFTYEDNDIDEPEANGEKCMCVITYWKDISGNVDFLRVF